MGIEYDCEGMIMSAGVNEKIMEHAFYARSPMTCHKHTRIVIAEGKFVKRVNLVFYLRRYGDKLHKSQ